MKNLLNDNLPLVSVIIPCRDEEKFIGKCLDSVIAQDYSKDTLEVLVVDGASEDRTREIVKSYIQRYPFVRIIDNPKRITSCALNLGIRNAKGKLILWMSAHNEYGKEYILRCIKYMEKFSADAVGGVIKIIPRSNKLIDRIICIALSHPFGVGGSAHKIGSESPKWVDAAFGVCYKKGVFDKIGFFNAKLIRGQDMEFSLRMKRAGLKTLLVPEITSHYYARSDLSSFMSHNFINGMWAILPFKHTNIMPVSLRHLVPLGFAIWLLVFGIFALFTAAGAFIFVLTVGMYSLVNFYFSLRAAMKKKDFKILFLLPIIFFILHFSYGIGSAWGLIKLIFTKTGRKNIKLDSAKIRS